MASNSCRSLECGIIGVCYNIQPFDPKTLQTSQPPQTAAQKPAIAVQAWAGSPNTRNPSIPASFLQYLPVANHAVPVCPSPCVFLSYITALALSSGFQHTGEEANMNSFESRPQKNRWGVSSFGMGPGLCGSRAQAWMVISSARPVQVCKASPSGLPNVSHHPSQSLGTEANPHEEEGPGMVRGLSGERACCVSNEFQSLEPT